MKLTTILIMISLFQAVNLSAGDDSYGKVETTEAQTLLGSDARITGYGGPEVKVTDIMGTYNTVVGGRGGVIVNSMFSFGGAFYMMVSSPSMEAPHSNIYYYYDKSYVRMMYGGLFLEFIAASDKIIHLTVNTLIGAGGVARTGPFTSRHMNDDDWLIEGSSFFVVEPGAAVEVNIAKPFRIALGAGYRFVSGLNMESINNIDLTGLSLNLTLKFGKF